MGIKGVCYPRKKRTKGTWVLSQAKENETQVGGWNRREKVVRKVEGEEMKVVELSVSL